MLAFEWFYALVTLAALVALVMLRLRREPMPLVGLVGSFVAAAALTSVSMLNLFDAIAEASQPSGILQLVATGSLSASMALLGWMLVDRLRGKEADQPAG